jgi:hypothetical protein
MMGAMLETDGLHIDCHTCVAANTTACNDCIATHLLANDDGPIELVVTPRPSRPTSVDLRTGGTDADADPVVERFVRAGLLDDPPVFVDPAVFAAGTGGDLGALVAT